jgi:putative ABC transport system permease protein
MLIFLFGLKEKSTDKSIPDVQNIYVLTNNNGKTYFSQKMVDHVKKEVAEMDDVTYCSPDWSPQVFLTKNQESYKVNKMITADSCFFRVFPFKTVWGDPKKAFNTANKIVLTRSLSKKIFGKENPVGKSVTYNSTYLQGEELEVLAVVDDLPQTISWEFDAVLSFQTNYKISWYAGDLKSWGSRNYRAFAKVNKHASEKSVLSKLTNINLAEVPEESRSDIHYGLFPFAKAYFNLPQLDVIRHGNKFILSVIEIVGILILLLACVNYVNMVTAQREKRYKSIGIFKTLGSTGKRILGMTTTESLVLLFFAVLCSVTITILLLPGFNLLSGSKFSMNDLFSGNYLLLLLLVGGTMILLTGIVPGIIFSKKPAILLIRKKISTVGNNWVRNSLLVFQFTVSIALITSILFIYRQNDYLQNQSTGFNKENIVYANTNNEIANHIDAFKNELKKIPEVADFTFSESVLIANDQNWGMDFVNRGETYNVGFSKMSVASNFFEFFGVKINEGNTFSDASKANGDFIFNRKAKTDFRIEKLEDARVNYSNPNRGRVIGIADDYNFESLHVPIRAAGYMCSGNCDDVIYLKINTGNLAAFNTTMKEVEQLWKRISPNFPLEYKFLDQTYTALYARETQFQRFLLYTTLISLVLSCLGLVGLTFFVMEQRTKEIGVRKVNGAGVSEVLAMLNRDFVKWVAIAFVIATPITYYAMNKWLESFAYKTELSWWIFAMAGLLALGIALLTVSWQSWKAATRNPVEALRYE